MKKIISIILALLISLSVTLSISAEGLSDISTHWARNNITYLYNLRYIGGYPDGTYRPNNPVNVAEFLKLATLGLGYKLENGQQKWYENYVKKAIEIGLIKEGEFSNLTAPLTREQVAKIAVLAVLQKEENPSHEQDELIRLNIRDYSKISNDKKQAVIDAYRIGLLAGNPNSYFNPKETLTRAEMCTVIMRIMDKAKRQLFAPKNGFAIKINNIFSGEPYTIVRPEKKEEIGLAYVMREALGKDKGWYYVSYYPDSIGCGFYNTEQEFKDKSIYDAITHLGLSINLFVCDNITPTYDIVVWKPLKAKELHREPILETFKYLFGQDCQKAMALYDKCLNESIKNIAKPTDTDYFIGNRKVNIYRTNSAEFVFNIYKKEK